MACTDCAKDFEELDEEIARLKAQLDELIGVVYENCNSFSAPYCLAEAIEWGNRK
jgi:hypothetical protein